MRYEQPKPARGEAADRIIGAVCDLDPTDYPDDDPDTLRVSRADLRVIIERETATLTERLGNNNGGEHAE